MNHIYKVIWNKAKHCYTVVSEIAKNHSTNSVTKKKVSIAAILAVGMLSGFSPMVSGAADTIVYDQNGTSLKSTNSNGVGENAIALGKGASAVKDSIAIGNGASVVGGSNGQGGVALGEHAHAGYKGTSLGNSAISGREGTIVIGDTTNASSLYSTVVGTNSKITSDDTAYTLDLGFFGKKSVIVQGAVSTSFGADNTITNKEKVFSGVANSIIGSVNTVTNSNGVTIQGTGNTVSNAYKDMNIGLGDLWNFKNGDYSSIAKQDNGAIAIIGGGNTISDQLSSTVIGFGNILKGENSTGVFTAGSNNTLTNVSNSLVMGDNNTLTDRKNVISLGNNNTVGADNAVAIGNGTTVSAESGVAIGVGSVADRAADIKGAFAPDTIPTAEKSTWTSTKGAVSVGDTANNITRQITNVAAGNEDTDAVNVAQLKQVASQAEKANQGWNLSTNGAAATNVAPGGYVDFSGDDNISVSNKETKVTVALNKNINVNNVQTNALNAKYNLSVGTANENGTVPFFVNSNGAFYAANGKLVVDKDGKVTATEGEIGNVVLKNGVLYKNTALRDGELYVGDTDGNYSQITSKNAKLGKVMIDDTGRISGVAAGRIAADSTDAINGSQLHAVQQEAGKHTKVVNGSNITVEETDQDGQKTYKVGLNKDLLLGDITGKNVSISGTNGTIETTGSIATKDKIYADKGAKLADVNVTGDTISNDKSSVKLDKDGTVTINNKVTVDQNGKVSGVAAGDISDTSTDAVNGSQLKATNDRVSRVEGDITNIKSDITDIKGDVKNLGDRVTKVEQEAGKHTKVVNGSNVTVEETDQDGQKTYKVGLNKDLLLGDITGKNVSISGTNGTIETTGSIATKDKIYADKGAKLADIDITGDTISNDKSSVKLDKNGTVTINNKVTVDQDGKVSGVAIGDISADSKDAVNGSQLFATNQQVTQNAQSISKLGNRINKVGAGAAALAALHPLDFDPDDKWDFAAGYGNYNGENAAAIGAYYRPNEDTMFSVGGSFGNGENMVNAGVSLKLGQGNHVSTSKVAMAKEIKDLRKELEGLKSALLDVNAGKKVDTSKLQLFPDVPKNHWAYEYVSTLKGNGMLTGYPDGEFKGDRPMTRYEFATMLYKAMLEGATLSDKILKEFAPELERFTVDTVHQDKDGKPTVERVRTVKAEK